MNRRTIAGLATAFFLSLSLVTASAEGVPPSGNPVFDRTVALVDEHFYSAAALPAFHDSATAILADIAKTKLVVFPGDAVDRLLASLHASHTGRFTADRVDYYELMDVFRYAVRRDLRRLFPPDGDVTYEGIGIASKVIDGKLYVTDVYDGGPAKTAGVMAGDEILSADGQPFAEIGSFKGKAGQVVSLSLRRTTDARPMTVPVKVARLQPGDTFVEAIADSAHVVTVGNRKIGVIHLWTYTRDDVTSTIYKALATTLKDVDGLVLDLRSRWGGAPGDAAETFVGGTADMTMTERGKEPSYVNERFRKPIVAIIDEGSRSGMELLAYSLRKNGIPLVGAPTAGAVLAATGYMLPDDSFLLLPVADVHVDDGLRLEATPIVPDIAVPFDVRYANGADPQFDAAMAELTKKLAAGSVN